MRTVAKYSSWMLTGSVWPITVIVISYLAFVLKIGPEYMKNREPLQIKKFLLVYNLFQAMANAYMLSNVSNFKH